MKMERWLFVSDTHGDMIDPKAEKALKELVSDFKPTIRIHGGDLWDLRCLRRGASGEETLEDLRADLDAGRDFIEWFKPTHFLRGNHDERLVDAMESHNPVLRRFACTEWQSIVDHLKAVGCRKILPYGKRHGVLQYKTIAFCHGFSAGIYAAAAHARIYGNVVFGHTHAIDAFSIPGIQERVGRNAGCLCRLDMAYNRGQLNTLRQSHGFAYGFLARNGAHRVFQAQEIYGKWLFPTEFKEYRP
jgi:predicted phosphodiesterase